MSIKENKKVKVLQFGKLKISQLDDDGKTGMKNIQKNILSATKNASVPKSKLKKIQYQIMKRSSCMVENYGHIFTKTDIWENENYDTAYIKKVSTKSHDYDVSYLSYINTDNINIKDNYDVTYIGKINVNEEDNYDVSYVGFVYNVQNISQ